MMPKTPFLKNLVISSALVFAPIAHAQETLPAGKTLTIDGVTLDGESYNSVTISSETPLTLTVSEGGHSVATCDRDRGRSSTPHFGRNGELTPREMEMAQTAWCYFERNYQESTGLVNAVNGFPSTTMWDTASYISGLVAAYELCIVDKRVLDTRIAELTNTLRNLSLFEGEAPNKVCNASTGQKVNYANEPGQVGMSANDIGRLLIWLRIIKEKYPHHSNAVDNIPMRWNFCSWMWTIARDPNRKNWRRNG